MGHGNLVCSADLPALAHVHLCTTPAVSRDKPPTRKLPEWHKNLDFSELETGPLSLVILLDQASHQVQVKPDSQGEGQRDLYGLGIGG